MLFFLVQKRVIQTKSVKYMPFYLSLANFANGIIWSLYALLKFDPNILVILSVTITHVIFTINY